ncbi:MAG TPA: glycosyltransferase family 4 protein [Pyrinomonadaceae bacterium]|nr:glycosyltransferase family 4 protein [Pyrinomonadaceae bacterium]
MRILHISSARSLGGGERHLADLANALARRGHDVYAAVRPRSPLREELAELPPGNVLSVSLRNALDVRSARSLARFVRAHKIEVVHAHVARDYPLAAMACWRSRRAKFVITRHVLFHLSRLHTLTLARASRVIAVSRAVERSLLAQKIFPARKVTVIPNGIDFGRFDSDSDASDREEFRRRLKVAPRSLLVGTVGELKRQKGHEDFLRAAAAVAGADESVHFIIAGADTTRTGERRAALERLAAELRLKDRVTFTGWLDDTAPLLRALDVYVSASHTESFGLAIVEAMAAGRAVVATATEGAREIIGHEETGLVVPVGDHEALAASVLRLLKNEGERGRLGERARTAARERFSLDRMVDATERVYKEMMNAER